MNNQDKEFFLAEIFRLKTLWATKTLDGEFPKLLFKKVNHISKGQFKDVVNYLILNHKYNYAPKLQDFMLAIEKIMPRKQAVEHDVLPLPSECFKPTVEWFEEHGKEIGRFDPDYNHDRAMKVLKPVVKGE